MIKKSMKIVLGIIFLLLVGGFSLFLYVKSTLPSGEGNNDIVEGYYKTFESNSPLEKKYSQLGTYETSYTELNSDNESIHKIRFWFPKDIQTSSKVWPMILVVNASGTPAASYEPFFTRLASWGFIVVGNEDSQTGSGETASLTLDYVLNLPEDNVLINKIDYKNMGIIGYSQGGAGAISAITNYDNGKYFKTIFTGSAAYPTLAKNMDWEYDASKIAIPYFMSAGTGKSDDSGKNPEKAFGGVSPLSGLIENYNKVTDNVMKVRGRVVDAEHEQMLMRTDGYVTAWMLYHLADDEEAGRVFLGDGAEILHNDNWQDIEKNR